MSRWIGMTMLCLLAVGCTSTDDPLGILQKQETASAGPPPATIKQTPQDVQRRFQSGDEEDSGAVQNAVMWAQRYEEMSLKNNELREQNNRLFLENNQLKADTDRLQASLESTRRELNEANEFLQQMHVELNQWKSDVLGFRDEMRQAQGAQLEALAKILRVLGAEPVELTDQPQTPAL